MRQIIPQALELIKQTEKLVISPDGICRPYQGKSDVPGVMTLGWGHVVRPAEKHLLDGITREEADKLFAADVADHVRFIQPDIGIGVTIDDWLYGALASFCFNLGPRILVGSSITEHMRKNQRVDAIFRMYLYNKSGSPPVYRDGLFYRRLVEMLLALTGKLERKPDNCLQARYRLADLQRIVGVNRAKPVDTYFTQNHKRELCNYCKSKKAR